MDGSGWTTEVRDALESLRQGHLVKTPPFTYYADGRRPIHALTRAWADAKGPQEGTVSAITAESRPAFGIITTQTCDLVEEGRPGQQWLPKRPWVQVAPVYFRRCASPGEARGIREGRYFAYLVWTSALGQHDHGVWVADLRISVPVEKGWFVGRRHCPAFCDVAGARAFGDRLAQLVARPAYPRALNDLVLRPLRDRLEVLCQEHPAADGIEEVRLELGYDRGDPNVVRIVFIGKQEIPAAVVQALSTWWHATFADDQPAGLVVLESEFTTFERIGALRYRRLDPVDLSTLSPPA